MGGGSVRYRQVRYGEQEQWTVSTQSVRQLQFRLKKGKVTSSKHLQLLLPTNLPTMYILLYISFNGMFRCCEYHLFVCEALITQSSIGVRRKRRIEAQYCSQQLHVGEIVFSTTCFVQHSSSYIVYATYSSSVQCPCTNFAMRLHCMITNFC